MSSSQSSEKVPEMRDVDLSLAGRGVWLVKVPKYLSTKWKKTQGKVDVGKLRITKSKLPGKKPDVTFTLNDAQVKAEAEGQLPTPRDHTFNLTGVGEQNLVVYSQQQIDPAPGTSADAITERIAIEGKVIQRAECKPVADLSYLKLKKTQMDQKNNMRREVKQITGVVNMYKPVSDHQFNIQHQKQQKEAGKRIRADKDQVMNKLFAAFETHQYYNISDLVRLTNQPITYLKEILKEICVYNVKAPHRNMWELKPEFRHYKDQKSS